MSIEERPSSAASARAHATRASTPARGPSADRLAAAAAAFGVPVDPPSAPINRTTQYDPRRIELRDTWDPTLDSLELARNAHRTNAAGEMEYALSRRYNWLEGDVRVDGNDQLVMAHDSDDEGNGLTLGQWLAVGGDGQRGLKLDIKEHEGLAATLDAVEASGIPSGRLMFNVGELPVGQLREIRERFPDAWIALNPARRDDRYHADDLARIGALADDVGGRITFPLRWDIATDEVIDALQPHGSISVWTSKQGGTPDDTEQETARLRERGVDGMIDLGRPSGLLLKLGQWALDIWRADAVDGVRDLASDTKHQVLEAADDVRDLTVGAARDVRDGVAELFD